jgi:hypothetical protein
MRLQCQETFSLNVSVQGRCLINEDGTRTFWALPVQATDDLLSTVRIVDDVLRQYGQPTYYDPPLFHVSVASVPLAVANSKSIDEAESWGSAYLTVREVSCAFGTTKQFDILLC